MACTRLDLLQFLKHAVHVSHPLRAPASAPSPIYVLGNPSADLDSIISAILYSYLASSGVPGERTRQYVPVVNLPDVRSGRELWRLRPEFVTALKLATSFKVPGTTVNGEGLSFEQQRDAEGEMLKESILTIADLKERFRSENDHDASNSHGSEGENLTLLDVVMVDWNSLPLTSYTGGNGNSPSGIYEGLRMSILGCIDHHEDESFVPVLSEGSRSEPRCIQTGVGSCASLVVRELRSRGIWKEDSEAVEPQISWQNGLSTIHEAQVAKLALAAILADTANMTAESKVSDVDRAAVSFLEGRIQAGTCISREQQIGTKNEWDRQSFYDEIMRAKSNSVEHLTMDEILGRDYKEWTESSPRSGQQVKIGICNVVRPISWILTKANEDSSSKEIKGRMGPYDALFDDLASFSLARELDIVVLMTVFTGPPPDNEFSRELLVWDFKDGHKSGLDHFESVAIDELALVPWKPEQQTGASSYLSSATLSISDISRPGYKGIWHQNGVTKSRKQIAPLLRNILNGKTSRN